MADFPTLGINFDLTEVVQASRQFQRAKSDMLELGGTSEEMAKEVEASATRVVNAAKKLAKAAADAKTEARGKSGKPPKTAEEIQMEAITRAIGEKSRFWRQRSAEQMAAERSQAAQSRALADAEQKLIDRNAQFRGDRIKRAFAEEEALRARNQSKAQADAAIQQQLVERNVQFRVERIKQAYAEEQAAELSAAAAKKAILDAAQAEERVDADLQKTLAERNSQFRVEQIKRVYAEEEAARNRHLSEVKADAEIERRLAERNMDFRAQRIIQQGAGGGRGGGIISSIFGGGDNGRAGAFGGTLNSLNNTVGKLRTSFLNARFAVAAFMGALTVAPLINVLDTMTALQARVSLYAKAQSDVPYTFEALYQTAQQARQPLEGIATLYTRLAPLADQLGKSQSQLLAVTKTVAQSFAIGGASAAESASSSQQLAQALASNRLGGDELRSLAENAPVLLQLIAKQLNMNSAQFIKWAHEGKASASVVINAIEGAAGKIDEMFKNFPVTIGQSITLVSNSFDHLVDRVNVATGASRAIAQEIAKIAVFMDQKSTIDGFTKAVQNTATVLGILGKAIGLVVQNLPALGAGLLALGAASAAPAVMSALATALTAVQLAMSGASGRALVFNQVLGQASGGVRTLWSSIGGLSGLLTGAFVIAVVAATAAVTGMKKAQDDARDSANAYKTGQAGVIGAIERAIAFNEVYQRSTDELSKALRTEGGSSDAAADAAARTADAHSRAMQMALDRANAERALTQAMLEQEGVQAGKRAETARKSVSGVFGLANQQAVQGALGNVWWLPQGEKDTFKAARQNTYDLRQAALESAEKEDARQKRLEALAKDFDKPLTAADITNPSGNGKPTSDTKDPTKGIDGAINRIAKMRAEVEGLVKQIAALSADPLSDLSARINAAGEEAAAQYTAGKAKGFANEARVVAQQKEEASIRLQLTQAMVQQNREQANEAAQLAITSAARERGTDALTAYWASANRTAAGYADALRKQADAETEGLVNSERLRLAQEYGVKSIDQIAAAYQKATGASDADAVALQRHVAATAEATAKTIRLTQAEKEAAQAATAANERTQQIADLEAYAHAVTEGATALSDYNRQLRIRAALQAAGPAGDVGKITRDISSQVSAEDQAARAERKKALDDELRIARMTAEQRDIEAEAMQRVDDAVKRGSENSQELSVAWQKIQVATEQSKRNVAEMEGQTKDAVRNAFIDTGKINFKPLGDALKTQLRRALYDAWLAKPIEMIIKATIEQADAGQKRLKDQASGLWDSLKNSDFGKGVADIFTKATSKFGDFFKKFLGNGGKSLKEFGGNTIAGYQTGTAVADALGIQGSGSHPTWQKVMDVGAAAIGNALGGPIGAAVATFISRALGKVLLGKNSNNGAIASFDANGNFTGSLTGSKRNEETSGAATAAATAITQGTNALRELGARLTTTVKGLDIGTRDTTHIDFSGGQHLETAVGDADAAVQASLLLIARSATFGDAALQKFVDKIENSVSTIDDLITKIQAFQVALDFRKSISTSVLQYTDPREYALQNLRDTQVKRRQQAAAYNAEGFYTSDEYSKLQTDLSQLEKLEIGDLLSQLATGLNGAVASLAKLKEAQDNLATYLSGLLTGPLSPLSAQDQLALSGDKFNQLLAQANGGNLEAFNQLTGASDEYLTAAQKYFGGTEAYAKIFQTVYDQLQALSTKEFEDPLAGVIEEQTQLLIDAINGVTAAINGDSSLSLGAASTATQAANDSQVAALVSGGTMSQAQVDQIVAAITASGGQVTNQVAAAAEAQVNATSEGLSNLTDAAVKTTSTAVALSGGQVRTEAA